MLKKVGIVKSKNLMYKVFNESISDDFLSIPKMKSSEYVSKCWNDYQKNYGKSSQNNSMNGNIFELIIESELYRQSLYPMYIQAQVAFVPNAKFDILLYEAGKFPIGLSLKTSLRERYKQADLEAVALKYVHRKALNYLITLDEAEAKIANEKAKQGDLLGINEVIVATNKEFDIFIELLSSMTFINPGKIDLVRASRIIEK